MVTRSSQDESQPAPSRQSRLPQGSPAPFPSLALHKDPSAPRTLCPVCNSMHRYAPRARWCTGHIRLWHLYVGQLNFSPLPLPCPDRDKSTAQRSLPSSLINTTAPPTGQNSLTCTRFSLTGPLYLPPLPHPPPKLAQKKEGTSLANRNRIPQPQPAPTLPTPACTYLSDQPNQPKTSQPLTVLGDPSTPFAAKLTTWNLKRRLSAPDFQHPAHRK